VNKLQPNLLKINAITVTNINITWRHWNIIHAFITNSPINHYFTQTNICTVLPSLL